MVARIEPRRISWAGLLGTCGVAGFDDEDFMILIPAMNEGHEQ